MVLALLGEGHARDRLIEGRPHAPHLIDAEVMHSLRRHTLDGTLTAADALDALTDWEQLDVRRHPAPDHLRRAWSLRDNVSAYDALYVALAEHLDCVLLTSGGRLARAPGVRCPVEVVHS